MPTAQIDLRGLAPDQAPEKEQLTEVPSADAVAVRGAVPALNAVLTTLHKAGRTAEVPVSWEPAGDDDSVGLARDLGLGTGGPRPMCLVRDDHGGVLLHHGRIEPADDDARGLLGGRLGLQAHHDEIKVADGEITRIDVRPDWHAVDTIGVTVMTPGDTITVYYNPKNPRDINTLVLLGAFKGNIILAIALAFLAFYVWFFWLRGFLRRSGPVSFSGGGRPSPTSTRSSVFIRRTMSARCWLPFPNQVLSGWIRIRWLHPAAAKPRYAPRAPLYWGSTW